MYGRVGGEVFRLEDGRLALDAGGPINSLARDREGTWWVATTRNGLYRLRRTPISMIDTSDELPAENVYGVVGGARSREQCESGASAGDSPASTGRAPDRWPTTRSPLSPARTGCRATPSARFCLTAKAGSG